MNIDWELKEMLRKAEKSGFLPVDDLDEWQKRREERLRTRSGEAERQNHRNR